jgi:quercetin dioxygenase-like cupin family protein
MARYAILTHVAAAGFGIVAAVGWSSGWLGLPARAQAPGSRAADLVKTAMPEIGREMRIRVTERDPGNASAPHRHPCCHTFGYVLEGTYEFKVNDEPARQLKAGDTFYEPPGGLHAVSRNPSATDKVRYLIIQVADPGKEATIAEK